MKHKKIQGAVSERLRHNCHRFFGLVAVLASSVIDFTAFAQSTAAGSSAINQIASQISNYKEPVTRLVYAIAIVLAIVGALKITVKMWNGDQDVQKQIVMYFGGALALCALASLMPAFFE